MSNMAVLAPDILSDLGRASLPGRFSDTPTKAVAPFGKEQAYPAPRIKNSGHA